MALEKQTIAVNFGQGLDQKTDPKLVAPGKLLVLENGVFKKSGRIDKRQGYQILSSKTLSNDALTSGSALAVYKDELLQYNKQKLYSYSEGASKWLDKGSAISAIVETKQVINNTAEQLQVDSATNQGVTVYAWEDTRGGVRASAIDQTTGTAMLSDVSLSVGASQVRVLAFSYYIYVFYYNAGSLYVQRLNPLSPTSFDAAVVVSTTVNTTNPCYDVNIYVNQRMLFAHNVEGSTATKLGWLDAEPTVLSGAFAPISVPYASDNCLTVVLGPSTTYYMAYHNDTDGLNCIIFNLGLSVLHGPIVLDATTSPQTVNVTGYTVRSRTGVEFFYEVYDSVPNKHYINSTVVSTSGSATSPVVFLRSVGLWGKAFRYDDPADTVNRAYVPVVYDSDLQASYFIARQDGIIAAKLQYGLAAGLTSSPVLQNINMMSATNFQFAILNKTQLISENATLFSQLGVARSSIDFGSQEVFNFAELGNNLHIVGGVLSMYDGVSVVEHGFHVYPEEVSLSTSGSSGVPNGVYQYVATYEWKDNYGNTHSSAPSVPVQIAVSGGPKTITATIDTLRLTEKKGNRTNVTIHLWRTVDAGSIFYRVSSVTSPTYNNVAVDTVTISDSTDNTAILSNQILYTVGGVLNNMAAPACTYIAVFKNRLFLAGLENPLQTWYSKINQEGQPVEFAAELTQLVDPEGGGISALSALDDKLVFFKQDRFYITYGDGPNNTGQGSDFAQPQFVTADAGCISSRSIIRVPSGIMFKSRKGLYALTSDLQMDYVGSPVEDYNSLTVTSASLKADVNQVRFTTLDGSCLVYDYYFKQWSTFTNHKANDSLIWNKLFIMLKTDGNVYYEKDGYFKDNGASYSMRIGSSWLALDQVTGFQRCYDLAFLGEYKSPHTLRVQVGYDFSPAYQSTIIFNPDTDLPISVYGEDPTYGESEVYGGSNSSYRWKASMQQQKCQAIRFLIEDLTVSSTAGSQEAFTITSIALQVGIKGHLGRFKESQSIGTQGVS